MDKSGIHANVHCHMRLVNSTGKNNDLFLSVKPQIFAVQSGISESLPNILQSVGCCLICPF